MIIQVTGADTINKGGELMLRAVVAQMGGDHEIAVRPGIGSFLERGRIGTYQYVENPGVPRAVVSAVDRALPAQVRTKIRERYGLIFESDVQAVLDASGFAYSDSFALARSKNAADHLERAARVGKKVVLLPQAFGPFTSKEHRREFERIMRVASLIFARDQVSEAHLAEIGAPAERVVRAPDFTCLLSSAPAQRTPSRTALIVPSAKMLTHAEGPVRDAYLPYVVEAARSLLAAGLDVKVLVHEINDLEIARRTADAIGRSPEVIEGLDALQLKTIIGTAHVVVASRFHALVGSLSQAVPSLGVGWSHKYAELFGDYGQANYLRSPVDGVPPGEILGDLLQPSEHERVSRHLAACSETQRAETKAMWAAVYSTLGLPPREARRARSA